MTGRDENAALPATSTVFVVGIITWVPITDPWWKDPSWGHSHHFKWLSEHTWRSLCYSFISDTSFLKGPFLLTACSPIYMSEIAKALLDGQAPSSLASTSSGESRGIIVFSGSSASIIICSNHHSKHAVALSCQRLFWVKERNVSGISSVFATF